MLAVRKGEGRRGCTRSRMSSSWASVFFSSSVGMGDMVEEAENWE